MADFLDVASDLRVGNERSSWAKSFDIVFNAISALQQVHSKAQLDITNIESVFAAFEMAETLRVLSQYEINDAKSLSIAMKEIITTTLQSRVRLPVIDRNPHPPPPYEEFVEMLKGLQEGPRPPRSLAVITFNYDLGLDYALYWKSWPVWYGIPESRDARALPLLKLHGSLNWGYCAECKKIFPWHLNSYFATRHWTSLGEEKYCLLQVANNFGGYAGYEGHNHPLDRQPYIVPPTWNKSAYRRELSPVWAAAAKEFQEAEDIIVIGYSLPPSDHFFHYMYALSTAGPQPLHRFWVFNPDTQHGTEARFRALLGPGASQRFRYFAIGFSKAIPEMRALL
jgi:hypothetical protein